MAGHNKWSQIKRQKEKTDAEKSKLYGKMLRSISLEAKRAKGNKEDPGLRSAIEKARDANVPIDNIERAVKKANEDAVNLENIIYEAYGPGGCALIIECLTNNKNRALSELKKVFADHEIELAAPGSALWAFEKDVSGFLPKTEVEISEEDAMRLEKLITDLENLDEVQEVYANAR